MPVAGAGGSGNAAGRQTFRPPWVKDAPPPVPLPTAPWKPNKASAPETKQDASSVVTRALRKVSDAEDPPPVRKTSKITIIPSLPKENGLRTTPEPASKQVEPVRKTSEPVPKQAEPVRKTSEPVSKQTEVTRKISQPITKSSEPTNKVSEPIKKQPEQTRKTSEPIKKVEPVKVEPNRKTSEPTKKSEPIKTQEMNKKLSEPIKKEAVIVPIKRETEQPVTKKPPLEKQKQIERTKTSEKLNDGGPPKPPPPPMPPMPPPPPPSSAPILKDKKPVSKQQQDKIEALKSRPKRRPDWSNMMKEIETGRKLQHVQCNDRSAPLLPRAKEKTGKFIYDSEKPNIHNQLLKQIEGGVRLKSVKTNDKSAPFIEGLRKFRRQMTIEEQIQKSASVLFFGAEIEPDPLDEVDDIDKVRDDLQSTKQMLALELKNKEALERENKKILTKLLNLEVELEKERNKTDKGGNNSDLHKEMKTLKQETELAKKVADEMETKYHDVQGKLDLIKIDLEEEQKKSQRLEKQLKTAQAANLAHSAGQHLAKQPSAKKLANRDRGNDNEFKGRDPTPEPESESVSESEESESESDASDEEAKKAQVERRQARELKLLSTKLKSFKDKLETAKKERKSIKDQISKQQKDLKAEKKKYKELQKEVDKMSKLMNEDADDEEEEEEDEDEEEDESESESEESESESENESDGDLSEAAPLEAKKNNLQSRAKKYENLVNSLKKGNYLLKANVDRYKDQLNKQKEMSLSLQEDLNSVLAELG